jgi:hypothetical protein
VLLKFIVSAFKEETNKLAHTTLTRPEFHDHS